MIPFPLKKTYHDGNLAGFLKVGLHYLTFKWRFRTVKSNFYGKTVWQPIDSLCENEAILKYLKHYALKSSDVVVDVGAHVGLFSLYATDCVREAFAFEPLGTNFDLLMKNLKANNVENVHALPFALSDMCGRKGFVSHKSSMGGKLSDEVGGVCVQTLDSQIYHADFVKVNVEGDELRVLKGAEKLLRSYKPSLVVAVDHYPSEGVAVQRFLEGFGYCCVLEGSMLYAR